MTFTASAEATEPGRDCSSCEPRGTRTELLTGSRARPFSSNSRSSAAVSAALETTGHEWREDAPIVDFDGAQKASLYRATDGSIFLPFELDAPLDALLEERYLPPGGGGPVVRLTRRAYYWIKPLLPSSARLALRRRFRRIQERAAFPAWPAETSLHRLEALLLGYVEEVADEPLPWIAPWPAPYDWSLVLTHDVERSKGYVNLGAVRSVEERLNLRSAWYFVPERDYCVQGSLLESLRASGCEVGLHGLRHDGRDLSSGTFEKRLPAMREYAELWGASGFRSPATHRNRTFVQQLGLEHDSSWSDVARYEPQKGGSCSWLPFFIGQVVELPITMPMDHTVFEVLGDPTDELWHQKADFLRAHGGMALMLTHPDYLLAPERLRLYEAFLGRSLPTHASGTRFRTRSPPGGASGPSPNCSVRTVSGAQMDRVQIGSAFVSEHRPSPGIGRRTRRHESPVVIGRLSDTRPPAAVEPDSGSRSRRRPSAAEARPVDPIVLSTLIIVENDTVPADSRVWSMCLSLRRAGWEITVVSPKGSKRDTSAFERIEGVDIHRFQMAESSGSALGYLREYVLAFARIRRLVRTVSNRKRFDVVQACNPPDFLLLTAIRLRRQGAAAIFDHHDLSPELHAAKYEKGFFSRQALVLLERLAFSLADVTLATNESFRDVAVRRGRQAPENVFVVRNGPDLELFEPVEPDPALRSGSEHLIGYVGMMNSQDGIDLAVEALAALLRRRSDWHAVFVGDGEVLPDAERAVQRLGLEPYVTFTGFVRDRARLAQIISSCDVCLSPEPRNSLNEKSTLVKVAEYMAVGRPVVAFDLTETRRTAGEAAVYAERDDAQAFAKAIDDLLSDPERRARMGSGGRERARSDLGWNRSEEALIQAYARALERATSRSGRRSRLRRHEARDGSRLRFAQNAAR